MLFRIVLLLIIASSSAHAGLLSKSVTVGAGVVAYTLAKKAIVNGGPRTIAFASKRLHSYLKKHPDKVGVIGGLLSGFAIENAGFTDKALSLISQTPLLSHLDTARIKEDSLDFDEAKVEVLATLSNIKSPDYCTQRNSSDYLVKQQPTDYAYISSPVAIGNVGAFKDLSNRAIAGDALEHDHIPSGAAIKLYLKKKRGSLSPQEARVAYANATALEVSADMHKAGRTMGTKNKALSLLDAKDLRMASIKDFTYHFIYGKKRSSLLGAFRLVYQRNVNMCLYTKV
jgi:hypothetical protein